MPRVIGIDIGAARLKAMMLSNGEIVGAVECPSGGNFSVTGEKALQQLLAEADLPPSAVDGITVAGCGAGAIGFSHETRTDLSCHCTGVHALLPEVRTLIDVGDASSKALHVDENGYLQNFVVSGKCAGGSGKVLSVIAKVLQLKVEDISMLSLASKNRIDFNTGCLVFAESEAISRVAEGVAKEDLLAGIHRALAAQLISLAERIGIEPPLAMVGGGARDQGLVKAVSDALGVAVRAPKDPHMTAALGAALWTSEQCIKKGK